MDGKGHRAGQATEPITPKLTASTFFLSIRGGNVGDKTLYNVLDKRKLLKKICRLLKHPHNQYHKRITVEEKIEVKQAPSS